MLTALALNRLEPAPLPGLDLSSLAELVDTFAHALAQPLMAIQLSAANLERCVQRAGVQQSTETLRQAVEDSQSLYNDLFMLLQAFTGKTWPQAMRVDLVQLRESVAEPLGLELQIDPLNPAQSNWNLAIAESWLSSIVRNLIPLIAGPDTTASAARLQVSSKWLTLVGVGGGGVSSTDFVMNKWPKHANLTIARLLAELAGYNLTLLSETTQIKAVRISSRFE